MDEKLRGKFIVLDGPDGSGKSTQQQLLARRLTAAGLDVVAVRDPGSTSAGEAIRRVILSGDHGMLSPQCELLLFMAARAQMMHEKTLPALQTGAVVLCDRFVSSSCAYQGASGLDLGEIIRIAEFAVGSVWPDLTIILDVPPELGLARIRGADPTAVLDAMESRSLAFHREVRRIFLALGRRYPGPVEVVDAAAPPDEVHTRIVEILNRVDW